MGKFFSHHSSTSLPSENAPKVLVARSYSTCSNNSVVSSSSSSLLSLFRIRSKSLQLNFIENAPKLTTNPPVSQSRSHSRSQSRSSDTTSYSFVQTPITPTSTAMDNLSYFSGIRENTYNNDKEEEQEDDDDDDDYDESDVFEVFLLTANGTGAMSANTSAALIITPSPITSATHGTTAHSRKPLDLDCMLPPLPPTDICQFQQKINNSPEHQQYRKLEHQQKQRQANKAEDLANYILSLVDEDTCDYNRWAF